jgi:uncharacterized membrane protein YhaH (DUF805 family)
MDFVTAVKTCLSKYADFSGRARRSEYWWFFLFLGLGNVAFALADSIFGLSVLGALFALATAIPTFAAGARRLHDTGRAAWWLALPFVPILAATALMWLIGSPHVIWAGVIGSLVGVVLQVLWLASDTLPGANQYGPSPK